MAAHTVSDEIQPVLRVNREAVLVMLPLATDIGLTRYFDSKGRRHYDNQS
jgi:hypothetical protein